MNGRESFDSSRFGDDLRILLSLGGCAMAGVEPVGYGALNVKSVNLIEINSWTQFEAHNQP